MLIFHCVFKKMQRRCTYDAVRMHRLCTLAPVPQKLLFTVPHEMTAAMMDGAQMFQSQSYIVRIWWDDGERLTRISVQNVKDGIRREFATLDELAVHIRQSPPHPPCAKQS